MFGKLASSPKFFNDAFKNIEFWDSIVSFSGYRLFSKPEVTLFSPENAINFHFRLGKMYIFG